MKDLSTCNRTSTTYSGTSCTSSTDCLQGCFCVDGQCVPSGEYNMSFNSHQYFSESYLLDLILEGRITIEESKRLKELADSKDPTLREMATKLLYETA